MKVSWKTGALAALAVVVAGAWMGTAGKPGRRPTTPAPRTSRAEVAPRVAAAPRVAPSHRIASTPRVAWAPRTASTSRVPAARVAAPAPEATAAPFVVRTPAPAGEAPGVAGAVVAIDPKTGKLVMPTPEQMQRLTQREEARVSRSPEGLIETHYPNGMVEIDLQGRFQDYATVRIRPDGTKEFHCVTDTSADAMARAAQAEAAGTTPEATARRGAGAPKEER